VKEPELVNASQEELDELLTLAKTSFPDKQYKLLEGVLGTFVFVMLRLQNAKSSIKRLQRMIFGARTEHKRNVLPSVDVPHVTDAADWASPAANQPEPPDPLVTPKPKPGHGRNAAQAYSGAPIVECKHTELESGDRCPSCEKGKVYDSPPRTLVKVIGQAPLAASVYRLQRLRCRLCDAIFTAPLPAGVASYPKYDASCASMIALLRYGSGLPHFRLEGLQASLYVPLPDVRPSGTSCPRRWRVRGRPSRN